MHKERAQWEKEQFMQIFPTQIRREQLIIFKSVIMPVIKRQQALYTPPSPFQQWARVHIVKNMYKRV